MKRAPRRLAIATSVGVALAAVVALAWYLSRPDARNLAQGSGTRAELGSERDRVGGADAAPEGRVRHPVGIPVGSREEIGAAGVPAAHLVEILARGMGAGPLEGVELVLLSGTGDRFAIGSTDAGGRHLVAKGELRLDLRRPNYLEGRLSGWASASVALAPGVDRVELVLAARGGGLDVLAVDQAGAPIPGARLDRLVRLNRLDPAVSRHALLTGVDGWARVRDLEPGVHRFRLAAPDHVPRDFLACVEAAAVQEMVVQLERGAALEVRVRDREGHPIAGAEVDVFGGDSLPGPRYGQGIADELGTVRFSDLPGGSQGVRVVARHGHHLRGEVRRQAGAAGPVEIWLERAARLDFSILDAAGRPLPGELRVETEPQSFLQDPGLPEHVVRAQTSPDGTGTAGPLPAGTELRAQFQTSPGAVLWRGRIPPLEEGEQRPLDLRLPFMARLGVRVRDEDGRPLAGSLLAFLDKALTEVEGEPRIAPLSFHAKVDWEGAADLWVQLGDLRLRFSDHLGQPSLERSVSVDGDRILELVAPRAAAIEGVLTDGAGGALAGWIVSLDRSRGLPFAVTDPDGAFRFPRVHSAGDLVVEDPLVGPVPVLRGARPGAERIWVRYARTRVEGRALGPDGLGREAFFTVAPAEGASSWGPRSFGPLPVGAASYADGAFALDLPPGTWRISARASGGLVAEAVVQVGGPEHPPLLEMRLQRAR